MNSNSFDTEPNSEDRALLKEKNRYHAQNQHKLQRAIKGLSVSHSQSDNDALIKISEITPPFTRSSSINLSSESLDHYRGPPSNDYECHICTIITCTICVILSLITVAFVVTLMVMGGIDIEPIDLEDASATVSMTALSKKSYSEFADPSNRFSDKIVESFIFATSLINTNETREMFNVTYQNIEPLFGDHSEHHTKISISADISSEKAMDNLLSTMVAEKKRNKEFVSEYTPSYLSNLESSFKSTIDREISLWYHHHVFEYPIVCTTKLKVNKITRGTIIGGIKYTHNEITHSIHSWKHEDVTPKQMFYVGDTIGISFVTKSVFTHHLILCDMTERMTNYMNENLKDETGPFKVAIDSKTVRCCVAPNGNMHDLTSTQCVGHQGDRQCNQYK